MLGGYVGNLLRVDLSTGKMWEEVVDDADLKKYGGQVGIGMKILWDEVPAGVKGKDPENRLILMTGPLTGTSTHCSSNFQAITRNPDLGNPLSWSSSHGFWGARLKFAGFDGIVFQGRSPKPVYLWVHDGQYELRDASEYWGKKDAFETEDGIRAELGQDKASVLTIGPAGENEIDSAVAQNDHGHALGNGSAGVVMGSKNLKAVAVYGTGRPAVFDSEKASETGKAWKDASMGEGGYGAFINASGTVGYAPIVYELGDLPIKNMTHGAWDESKVASLGNMRNESWGEHKWKPCWGCPIHHLSWITAGPGPYEGMVFEEAEYEGVSSLGSNLGISEPGADLWLQHEIDRLGLDTNWTGTVLGWAFEAYDRGLITTDVTGGLELKWGDEKAAAALAKQIAYKEGGLGNTFAKGMRQGVREIAGDEGESFLVHVKGKANKGHDYRSLWGMLLGVMVSGKSSGWETPGADLGADADVDIAPEDRFNYEAKPRSARLTQIKRLYEETTGVCNFGRTTTAITAAHYSAVTGHELTSEEALLMGERLANLARAFNLRHGYKVADDFDLGKRLLEAPPDGNAAGHNPGPYLEGMVKEYNRLMDWDFETGKPSVAKLEELGLNEVMQELYG